MYGEIFLGIAPEVFEEKLYPTREKKAAVLCCGIINNHSYTDGNKRIGMRVILIFGNERRLC